MLNILVKKKEKKTRKSTKILYLRCENQILENMLFPSAVDYMKKISKKMKKS